MGRHAELNLDRHSKNLSIITDALHGKSIQHYIDEEKKKRALLIEMMYKNCKE